MLAANKLVARREWRWVVTVSLLLMVLVTAPFLFVAANTPPDLTYMGLLNNSSDGASYLAKMAQGYHGSWLFTLPYTPEPHPGVFLYTFYLALGHVAAFSGTPLILVFHAARLIGSFLLFTTSYVFVATWTPDVNRRRFIWTLALIAGGLGWIVALLGQTPPIPPDLLALPEAFPLQAAYSNAHFPWQLFTGIWLTHSLWRLALDDSRWPGLHWISLGLVIATQALVSLAPFLLIPLGISYLALLLSIWRRTGHPPLRAAAWGALITITSLPLILYGLWAVSSANPVMQAWQRQNQTLSPAPVMYLIGFAPMLVLALAGWWHALRVNDSRTIGLLVWAASAFALSYAPTDLQRRFLTGINFPLVISAGVGLWHLILPRFALWGRSLTLRLVFAVTIPSAVIAIMIPVLAVTQISAASAYYLSRSEIEELNWFERSHEPSRRVALASPELCLYLPLSGIRVVYGHQYETLDGAFREMEVLAFYDGENCAVPTLEQVSYVVIGPREKRLAGHNSICAVQGIIVFTSSNGDLAIYRLTLAPDSD